jgi:gliding motility-associated-like protein
MNTSTILTGMTSETGLYQWTGPNLFSSNSLIISVSDSGWYYLNINYPDHCIATDSVFVNLDHDTPVANAGADQLIDCNHSDAVIDGSGSTGNNLEFVWSNMNEMIISTQPVTKVNEAGTYALWVNNFLNGCSSIDSANVFLHQNELSEVSVTVLPENCIDENNGMIEITGTSGGIPPYSYFLNGIPGNSSGQFDNLAPGVYELQIVDGYGCTLDTFFTINEGIDLQLTLPDTIKVKEDQASIIHAIVNVPAKDLSLILWNPAGVLSCDACLSPLITTSTNQTLELTVTHANGCVSVAEIYIIVIPSPNIYVPNTFTPNGDGQNDFFSVNVNNGVESVLELNIFDRWGDHLYGAKNFIFNTPGLGWDGKFHQKEMPSGIYVYYIKLLLADGSQKTLVGDVTLVR